MCGINGIFAKEGNTIGKTEQHLYEKSLLAIDTRGKHATGIYMNKKIIKMPLNAHEFLRVIKSIDRSWAIGQDMVLGHTRFATVGKWTENINNHPFETERFVFAHNGSYYANTNKKIKVQELYSMGQPETDSWEILKRIQYYYDKTEDIKQAIETALNDGYGVYAIWLYDKVDNVLYLYRDGNPLHVVVKNGFLWFASERDQLPKKLQKNAWQLKTGRLYKIDRKLKITKQDLDVEIDYFYSYGRTVTRYWSKYTGNNYDSCKYNGNKKKGKKQSFFNDEYSVYINNQYHETLDDEKIKKLLRELDYMDIEYIMDNPNNELWIFADDTINVNQVEMIIEHLLYNVL